MISQPEKLRIPSIFGPKVEVTVNWTVHAKEKYVKLRVGNEESIVPREDFVRCLLMLAKDDEQDDMIPTKNVKIRHFEKHVVVRIPAKLTGGDLMAVTVPFDVPLSEEAAIAMNSRKS